MSSVKLRKKVLKNDRISLYLDYYPPLVDARTGNPYRFVTLKLYLFGKAENELERIHNKETLLAAKTICAQRQIELQNRRFGLLSDHERNSSFLEIFRQVAKSKRKSLNDHWEMGFRYFAAFVGHELRLPELTDFLCEDYKTYLLSGPGIARWGRPIKRNTAVSYYAKFRAVLRIVYRKKLIPIDLHAVVDPISPKETHRERLTLEEFQRLSETPASPELLRNASLFSGLTGLRWSDVRTLQWANLRGKPGSYEIQFSQEKTENAELMPISDQAVTYLGNRGELQDLIFPKLQYNQLKTFLNRWTTAAGIQKKITFHSFRHTFATLQLELGTDIYTVSKLLGHRSLKNTEIYAKIVDKTKRTAAAKVMLNVPESPANTECIPSPSRKFVVHRNEDKLKDYR